MTGGSRRAPAGHAGRLRAPVLALLLLALVGAVFAGVRSHSFVTFDDHVYVLENPPVLGGLTLRGARWALAATHGANWHPLTWISHMADVSAFGTDAGAHKLVNVAVHGANAVLLGAVLLGLGGSAWRAALAAALFAAHPLHVESVAWVSERKDVLSTFFALLALALHVRSLRRGAGRPARAPAVAAYALALLAKPMPVTLPFLLLLLDWWPLGRWGAAREGAAAGFLPPWRLWREKLPFFALAGVSAAVTWRAQLGTEPLVGGLELPLGVRVANALSSYARYAAAALRPADLSVFYPHPAAVPPWPVLAGLALLLGAATLGAVALRRRHPWLLAGWLWYAGTLVPVIGLVQVGLQARADRYTYVPLVGLFVALAWELARLAGRGPRRQAAVSVPALCLVALFAAAARLQVGAWRDSRALFEHALAVDPADPVAHFNLGLDAASRRDLAAAEGHYRAAVRLKPDWEQALVNLAAALAAQGKRAEALERVRDGIRIYPWSAVSQALLGDLLAADGKLDEAAAAYRDALRADPGAARVRNRLGVALARAGRYGEASAEFEAALRADPGQHEARFNLAKTLVERGTPAAALPHFRAYLAVAPGDAGALAEYGDACLALGDREGARAAFRRARALDAGLAGSPRCLAAGSAWCGLIEPDDRDAAGPAPPRP